MEMSRRCCEDGRENSLRMGPEMQARRTRSHPHPKSVDYNVRLTKVAQTDGRDPSRAGLLLRVGAGNIATGTHALAQEESELLDIGRDAVLIHAA